MEGKIPPELSVLCTVTVTENTLGRPDYSHMVLSMNEDTFSEPIQTPITIAKVNYIKPYVNVCTFGQFFWCQFLNCILFKICLMYLR